MKRKKTPQAVKNKKAVVVSTGFSKRLDLALFSVEETLKVVNYIATSDGITETDIPFLSFIRSTQTSVMRQGVLTPSFCLLLQGRKKIELGGKTLFYGPGDYLLATVDMPLGGQIVGASKDFPYLGIKLQIDAKEIADVVIEAKIPTPNNKNFAAAFVGKSNDELLEAIFKLVRLLTNKQDANFLAGHIKREIIYRLLTGPNGHLLFQNVTLDNREQGIGKAIHWIKENYNRPIKMENLAKAVNMSVSGLHHKFKSVTTMGPLQYQKQLRLQEARRLLLSGEMDATRTAFEVGYESQSQFSREYRRLFGSPPIQDIKKFGQKADLENLPVSKK